MIPFIQKFVPFKFNLKLFIQLSLGFISFTIIGTLSHEFGHYLSYRINHQEARIAYAYTVSETESPKSLQLREIYKKRSEEIKNHQPYPEKEEYFNTLNIYKTQTLMNVMGGPIQTLGTSLIAFILILIFYHRFKKQETLNFASFLLVFFSLFSLRQVSNFTFILIAIMVKGKYAHHDDESRINVALNLPPLSLHIVTSLIGIGILSFIILKIIPLQQRFTFILSGIFGGVLGYLIWLEWLGPKLLPL